MTATRYKTIADVPFRRAFILVAVELATQTIFTGTQEAT